MVPNLPDHGFDIKLGLKLAITRHLAERNTELRHVRLPQLHPATQNSQVKLRKM